MSKKKIALITGITGQDGSYLAEFLLKKNYIVHGIKRRSSFLTSPRIDHLYDGKYKKNFYLHYGDLTDGQSTFDLIKNIKPDEIYNLAAQSHVKISFDIPNYSAQVNALGVLSILEGIKNSKKKIKFYQAGTSEMFGRIQEKKQSENTKFYPRSPYGVSKLYAHWITKNYREAYNIFACNGILFNHESPLRGDTFVTKKIVKALCKIKYKKQKKLFLGNLYSKRDWGHAKDYVEAMWKILQNKKPDDFVICTGKQYTIKYFVNLVAKKLNMKIFWKGKGLSEKALDSNGQIIIECKKKYFRPSEVNSLIGDATKAKKILKWKPYYNLERLVDEMIGFEIKQILDE